MLQNIVRVLHEPVLQKYWWRHIFLKHILEMSKSLYWLQFPHPWFSPVYGYTENKVNEW